VAVAVGRASSVNCATARPGLQRLLQVGLRRLRLSGPTSSVAVTAVTVSLAARQQQPAHITNIPKNVLLIASILFLPQRAPGF
jgi:hypothetical protein